MFRKNSQTSLECIVPGVLFCKVAHVYLQLCENRGSGAGFLPWNLWNFAETFYAEQLWMGALGCLVVLKEINTLEMKNPFKMLQQRH